jgi:poly(3-hydroxybutyrate) depolymerase
MFRSICVLFFLPAFLFCQTKKAPDYENLYKFENQDLNKYGYIITTPKNYSSSTNSVPLFIFLHGRSLRGNNLNSVMNQYGVVYEQKNGMQIPGVVLAPQCHEDSSWSYSKIDFLIEWTKQNYRIDNARIYILGMSMGGSGTWICGSRLNHKIAAMAPMCGGSYIDLGWTNPCALKKMPIWAFHGVKDEDVKVDETYNSVAAIKQCGGGDSLKVTYYQNAGHNLAFVFRDPKLYEWLLSHTKTDFTNYWIEEQTTPETNPNDTYNDNSNQSNFEQSKDENTTTPYSPPQNPVVEPPSPPTPITPPAAPSKPSEPVQRSSNVPQKEPPTPPADPIYQPPVQNTPVKTQNTPAPEASQPVPQKQPTNQPKVKSAVESPKTMPKTSPSNPKKEKETKPKKPKKAYLNETKLSIFATVNTTIKGDVQRIMESFCLNTGAEVEIPFHKTNRYYSGFYSKTGLFLYNLNSAFKEQINFDGIQNQNGYGFMPSQEIGFILFRGLKLGAGICYTNPNNVFTFSPYFSGAVGFKMDEYEIEFGSLAQSKDKKMTFFPSFTFKIRPIK